MSRGYGLKKLAALSAMSLALVACQPFGPTRGGLLRPIDVPGGQNEPNAVIRIINVNKNLSTELQPPKAWPLFAKVLDSAAPMGSALGIGDAIELTIWESPPATLFGTPSGDGRTAANLSTARSATFPDVILDGFGNIKLPFAGTIHAQGKTLREIETIISQRLQGKANNPQVQARLTRNVTATATIMGDVGQSMRLPLTPAGERLLDALAIAGGVKPPLNLATVQLTRNGQNHRMRLSDIVEKNENNIILAKDDIVTVLFQPYSFIALGATGRSDEIKFEAFGITLSQAMGRVGGLQDGRANPKGVFLFRWLQSGPDGRGQPVIYNFDFTDPSVYFVAQQFSMNDQDIIYVTNAPVAELQRFVGIISQTILPIATVSTITKN